LTNTAAFAIITYTGKLIVLLMFNKLVNNVSSNNLSCTDHTDCIHYTTSTWYPVLIVH